MEVILKHAFLCLLLGALLMSPAICQSSTGSTSTDATSTATTTTVKPTTSASKPSTTTSKPQTTTLTPKQECAKHNGSCEDCVKRAECMYCKTNDKCMLYPTGKVLPSSSDCALDQARWGVCWLNFEALIIAVSVVGGVIILTIVTCCIYCCCCRGRSKKKYDKDDAKFESQQMERKKKQDERRTERKSRLDEIRRKYGLVKDDAPYQRFDA